MVSLYGLEGLGFSVQLQHQNTLGSAPSLPNSQIMDPKLHTQNRQNPPIEAYPLNHIWVVVRTLNFKPPTPKPNCGRLGQLTGA